MPTHDITFLFTDVEGSTRLWESDPDGAALAIARHESLLREEIERHGGTVFKTVGDAVYAAFATPRTALGAAACAQRALAREGWTGTAPLRVRMAIHRGPAEERDGDFYGPTLNRLARILSAGHGGQVLVSGACAEAAGELPSGLGLVDLGEFSLRDIQLPERLFQLAGRDLAFDFPPLRTLGPRPSNLPAELLPLVGREAETELLRRLLLEERVRLVTLTGPGGIGKTRLALRVATSLLPEFPGGVTYVALAETRDADRVAAEIARAVGLRESGGQPVLEMLQEHLRDRRLLLVLDNFEQALSAAPLVASLLRAAQGSTALVTSRAPLRVGGEHEVPLAPLPVPAGGGAATVSSIAGIPAVELFVQRARAVRPGFELDPSNASAVAEICRRLDGLPLALELAAARIRTLPPPALLSRLGRRLQLLTGGARDLPARQQTLRDAIAWSYDLLSAAERETFAALSVFAGGFTLEAARRVCGTSDDAAHEAVSSLVQASLLAQAADGEEPRFAFLETIQEYATERLRASPAAAEIAARHLSWVVDLAEATEPHLRDDQQVRSVNRLEAEHDNFRAALERSLGGGDAETAARLAAALWRFWMLRAHFSEGRAWLERVLALPAAAAVPATVRVKLLTGYGVLVRSQGDLDLAERTLTEAVDLARGEGERRGSALALMSLGIVAYHRGDYARAGALHAESLDLWRAAADRWGEAVALTNLALVEHSQARFDRARVLYEESLAISTALGDRFNAAVSLHNLGNALMLLGEDDEARRFFERGVELRRELGDPLGLAAALHSLGLLDLRRGALAEAERALRESLIVYAERGDKEGIAASLEGLGGVAGRRDRHDRLARLYGAAEALRGRIGVPLPPAERPGYDNRVTAARSAMGTAEFEAAWREGRALTTEQAVALATE